MLGGPPDLAATLPDTLWSRKAVAAWLAQRTGAQRSAGAATRLCELLGLDFDDDSLAPPVIGAADKPVRYHGAERHLAAWPGVPADSGKIGLLCIKAARGQLLWLAFAGPLEARHYLALLDRLPRRRGAIEVAIAGSARLLRVPELSDWLAGQAGALQLIDPELGAPIQIAPPPTPSTTLTAPAHRTAMPLTHLQRLEAESIHIMREVVAEADKPVMLYSVGKDSAVMLHLAMKAFYPSKPPFPLMHVDTRWKFRDMYTFRDRMVKDLGMELITYVNPEGIAKNINPFTHGSAIHTDMMKTEGLKQALGKYGFDAAFGGARRDEEKSRAKERIFSFRSEQQRWDPKNQRPELWKLYNARKHKGESLRVFPLSNWTELDIWQYIHLQNIPIVPLYFAAQRPVVERNGTLIMVDDDRMPLMHGEVPMLRKVRFRTLGCYPLTGAIESQADTLPAIIQEMLLTRTSEREGRVIDHDSAASMEKKKQEGYF
nr:sulfate adenylyltransferase subunit CysD [Caenimonas soli]